MGYAGHLPTMRFDLATWQAMPVLVPASIREGEMAPDGWHRRRLNGKPIAVYVAPWKSGEISYAVRPIVRVPMGRRVVSERSAFLREWLMDDPRWGFAVSADKQASRDWQRVVDADFVSYQRFVEASDQRGWDVA